MGETKALCSMQLSLLAEEHCSPFFNRRCSESHAGLGADICSECADPASDLAVK